MAFNPESRRPDVLKGAAQDVLATQRDRPQLEDALAGPQRPAPTGYVVGKQQHSPGAQHPCHLSEGLSVVRDGTQQESAHHRVGAGAGHVECFRIAHPDLDVTVEVTRASPRDREHLPAEIDTGQPDVRR